MNNLIFDGVMILVSLLAAGLFGRQFRHVYRVGRENIIKSFTIGGGAGLAFFILLIFIGTAIPEGRILYAVFLVVLPVLAISFSTGCSLLAGLAGLDGGRYRFTAIFLVGAVVLLADFFFPYISKTVTRAVLLYGIGASVLSLSYPMAEEENPAGAGRPDEPEVRERQRLGGDLTPLPRRSNDEDAG